MELLGSCWHRNLSSGTIVWHQRLEKINDKKWNVRWSPSLSPCIVLIIPIQSISHISHIYLNLNIFLKMWQSKYALFFAWTKNLKIQELVHEKPKPCVRWSFGSKSKELASGKVAAEVGGYLLCSHQYPEIPPWCCQQPSLGGLGTAPSWGPTAYILYNLD